MDLEATDGSESASNPEFNSKCSLASVNIPENISLSEGNYR